MNQFDVVQGFLECGETGSPSPDQLAAEFLEAVQALGFRHFACCSHVDPFHPPTEAVMLHNYPRGWVRTYSEAKLYTLGPVLKQAERNPLPFFWDATLHSDAITKPQQRMMADAAGYDPTRTPRLPLNAKARGAVAVFLWRLSERSPPDSSGALCSHPLIS